MFALKMSQSTMSVLYIDGASVVSADKPAPNPGEPGVLQQAQAAAAAGAGAPAQPVGQLVQCHPWCAPLLLHLLYVAWHCNGPSYILIVKIMPASYYCLQDILKVLKGVHKGEE